MINKNPAIKIPSDSKKDKLARVSLIDEDIRLSNSFIS
jgi:hypothetical protein